MACAWGWVERGEGRGGGDTLKLSSAVYEPRWRVWLRETKIGIRYTPQTYFQYAPATNPVRTSASFGQAPGGGVYFLAREFEHEKVQFQMLVRCRPRAESEKEKRHQHARRGGTTSLI